MIEIGYMFPHNGAQVILTAPAGNDSIIVLCREKRRPDLPDQWITGRVYVRQLPHPEEWDSGTYNESLDAAVRHFMDRAGIEFPEDETKKVRGFVALALSVSRRLDPDPPPSAEQIIYDALTHMDVDDAKDITAADLTHALREKGLLKEENS